MAISKSSLKRIRQDKDRAKRNRSIRSACKTAIKRVDQSLENKDAEGANKQLVLAMSMLHKAASKGVIHHRTASRKIARLSGRISNQLASR